MKLLITIIFLSFSINIFAQSDLANDLLELEERYYFSNDSQEKQLLLIEKINCYLSHQEYNEELINEASRLSIKEITDSTTKANVLWNLSIIGLINKDFSFADKMIFEYDLHTGKKSINSELLKLHVFQKTDSTLFMKSYSYLTNKDSAFTCLICMNNIGNQEKYNEKRMVNYSKIIPGLGTIKAGDTRSGLFSITTHVGTIAGSVLLAHYGLYFNSITWGASLLPRFYSGNKILTRKTVRNQNQIVVSEYAKKCQEQTQLLLAKYPFKLRN